MKKAPQSRLLEQNWKIKGVHFVLPVIFFNTLIKLNSPVFRYLRSYKPYDPPSNVSSQVQEFAKSMSLSEAKTFKSLTEKFQFLNQCFMAFNHIVPNSKVHEIETVGEFIVFFLCEFF